MGDFYLPLRSADLRSVQLYLHLRSADLRSVQLYLHLRSADLRSVQLYLHLRSAHRSVQLYLPGPTTKQGNIYYIILSYTHLQKKLNFSNTYKELIENNMKTFFDLIMETADLYSFLLNVLIDVYRFSDFDISDEVTFFSLEFSQNSSVRQYVCTEDPSIKIDGMHINVVIENDVLTYKTSLTTNLEPNYKVTIKCSSLGYKDRFKVFTTKQDVLDECLRVENAFVKSAQDDLAARLLRLNVVIAVMLARERRTATYCCTELAAALAALPSRPLEMVADAVIKTNGEYIETTQVLEEDDEDDEDDYYIHYYDYYLDDEEEYFRKHK
jgi:hypothetical protein